MSALKSIHLAIELATRQRDGVRKKQAHAIRALNFVKGQLAQLESYAGETDSRLTRPGSVALSVELLRHHYQFVDRLQSAIVLQLTAVENAVRHVEQVQAELVQAELRLTGLNKVLQAREAVLLQAGKRREQRATDEFATLQFARIRVGSVLGDAA